MQEIYHILETFIPFSWIHYDFMKNAIIAVLLITPLFGILGTMIVNNKMAFFSDALGHSAITGIAIGTLLGISNTNISMIIFAIVFSLVLNRIKNMQLSSTDTIIAVFSSCGLATGLAILSIQGSFSKYSNLLIGDILSINSKEILGLCGIFLLTCLFWCLCFNKLNAMSVNQTLAKSKNINVNLIDNIFIILIAMIVMLSIKWVGLLLINALLILPAATSRNISHNMREFHGYSIIISVMSGVFGLIISYYNGIATGPMIVIIASCMFFFSFLFK